MSSAVGSVVVPRRRLVSALSLARRRLPGTGPRFVFVALLALVLVTSGDAAAKAPSRQQAVRAGARLTPVLQSVPSPPRWYRGDDGRVHLEYEVLLTNAVPLPIGVAALDVVGGGRRTVLALSGDALAAAMGWPDTEGSPTELQPFSVGVAWPDITFARVNSVPRRLTHRLTVAVPPTPGVPSQITSTAAAVAVVRRAAAVVAPPLRGGRWAVIVGPHRRALQPVNGRFRNSQRFAIDFAARLDGGDRTHRGDPSQNSSYFNYGQPVLAVRDGTVVEAVDRYPDQVPNHNAPLPLSAADGNHVVIRLANGAFAGYGHLQPGSVRSVAGSGCEPANASAGSGTRGTRPDRTCISSS